MAPDITDDAGFPADYDRLIAAADTLAALAEPGRDLYQFASDFRELATTLKFAADGLARAQECAEDRYDAIVDGRGLTLNVRLIGQTDDERRRRARQARDADERGARQAVARTARKALIDLARLIAEIEGGR